MCELGRVRNREESQHVCALCIDTIEDFRPLVGERLLLLEVVDERMSLHSVVRYVSNHQLVCASLLKPSDESVSNKHRFTAVNLSKYCVLVSVAELIACAGEAISRRSSSFYIQFNLAQIIERRYFIATLQQHGLDFSYLLLLVATPFDASEYLQ